MKRSLKLLICIIIGAGYMSPIASAKEPCQCTCIIDCKGDPKKGTGDIKNLRYTVDSKDKTKYRIIFTVDVKIIHTGQKPVTLAVTFMGTDKDIVVTADKNAKTKQIYIFEQALKQAEQRARVMMLKECDGFNCQGKEE